MFSCLFSSFVGFLLDCVSIDGSQESIGFAVIRLAWINLSLVLVAFQLLTSQFYVCGLIVSLRSTAARKSKIKVRKIDSTFHSVFSVF